ncbi:MAG TPA: hypothetical protein VGM54_17275 [Chthoniobacter sp.]|jgi:hypothetical protein
MLRQILPSLATLCLVLASALLHAEAGPAFRTDDNKDKSLRWFQLVDGQFPPPNSAHAVSGELIKVDHLEREFYLRVDRSDTQDRGVFDLPLDSVMLPYGSIYYHGAPAALQDIPLGTHLHGLFYLKAANDTSPPPPGPYHRVTPELAFKRCFQLEDDFSYYARQKQIWKIDQVNLADKKLTATLQGDGNAIGTSKIFDLLSSTLVFTGHGFGDLASLKEGQTVQFNLTWATLYGPGRVVEIWLDEPSRQLASAQQLERHRNHIRERGLPGWIDEVDDDAQIVTITFFGGVDPALFADLKGINPEPFGWPLNKPEDDPLAPKGTIAVARESLMTYDPLNDRKGGNILHIGQVPVQPGSSGVQIKVKCDLLLEGFRPHHIVRFYPGVWKVNALPREEQFNGRE